MILGQAMGFLVYLSHVRSHFKNGMRRVYVTNRDEPLILAHAFINLHTLCVKSTKVLAML